MYLEVKGLSVYYDDACLLRDINLHVEEGEFIGLVGPNGAGKTTLLRSIAGLVNWEKEALRGTRFGRITLQGSISFNGEEISELRAHKIAERKLILCPERGKPFAELSIKDNLLVGAYSCKDKKRIKENLEKVYHLFPILKERANQLAGTVSGGERTMIAIGRALMAEAELMLLDEPSTGIAPKVKDDLFYRIKDIYKLGITIFIVEQDVNFAFDLGTRHYVASSGRIVAEGSKSELLANDIIRKTYLGL